MQIYFLFCIAKTIILFKILHISQKSCTFAAIFWQTSIPMKKIYSKTIDTIDPEDGTKLIKIQVSDTPLMSDSEQVMEDIL